MDVSLGQPEIPHSPLTELMSEMYIVTAQWLSKGEISVMAFI